MRWPRVGFGALLVTLLAACAHRSPGHLKMAARSESSPDCPTAVAIDGTTVYALTGAQRLRVWDTATGASRVLDGEGVLALARDGAMALSFRPMGDRRVVLEAWEPRSGRVVARKAFANGVSAVLGVSRRLAIVDVELPEPQRWPGEGEPSILPPTSLVETWDLGSGEMTEVPERSCTDAALSLDGARYACGLDWVDRARPGTHWPPPLAPDWEPAHPRAAPPEPPCVKCGPPIEEQVIDLLSIQMSRDGSSMLLAYTGAQGHDEWRLERWVPDAGGKTSGRLERLAALPGKSADVILAASDDARVVVVRGDHGLPRVRRAPDYEPVPLPAPPVSAAVFSSDDARFVTGHQDGVLRLWDAATGRLVAENRP